MAKYKLDHGRDLSGPTELRIHGIGGAPPESLLDDEVFIVAGNETSGFYRVDRAIADREERKRSMEAYSWGGLTSGGTFFQKLRKSLWIVLLPYALVNASGWMLTAPPARSKRGDGPVRRMRIGVGRVETRSVTLPGWRSSFV